MLLHLLGTIFTQPSLLPNLSFKFQIKCYFLKEVFLTLRLIEISTVFSHRLMYLPSLCSIHFILIPGWRAGVEYVFIYCCIPSIVPGTERCSIISEWNYPVMCLMCVCVCVCVCFSHSVMSDFLWPHGISLPGSSVHGLLQARILEWVLIFFSRGSFQPREWIQVFLHCRQILYCLSHQGSPKI